MPSQRRVAYFCANFLPASQTFVYRELTAHVRYQAEVFARGRQHPDLFPFEPVHTLLPAHRTVDWFEAARYTVLRSSSRFFHRLRNGHFDLVHAQFGPAAAQAVPMCEALGLPMICTFGGIDVAVLATNMRFRPSHWAYWPYWSWSRRMFRRLDRILAVSQDLADRLVGAGAPEEKVHVFHRGIAVPTRVPPLLSRPSPVEILVVGRLVEKKGIEYALQAFARSSLLRQQARLMVVGDGPLRDRLATIIRDEGLHDVVQLLGRRPHHEVLARMERAQVVLVPSVTARSGDTEGVPNVLKEANARGVPVVGTRHGGITEIIEEGKTGLLVPERDAVALATAIERLIERPQLRARLGDAARDKMKREFDESRRIDVLESHYDDVIRAGGRRDHA